MEETASMHIDIQRNTNPKVDKLAAENVKFGRQFSDHMFIADYRDGNWTDLRIVPYGNLSLSPATSAIHYGQSIFEGMKAHRSDDGRVLLFRPEENWKRMNESAKRMCMPEISREIFMEGLHKLLELDQGWVLPDEGFSLYIRPFMFATDEYIGVKASNNYRFMIFTCPVGGYYAEPVKVKIETKFARAFEGGTGKAKAAGNYAASLYPAKLAQKEGYHQLVWTDAKEHKYFEESGTMNILFVIDDTIITPSLTDTILNGITRDSVLKIAEMWGMKVEQRPVTIEEVISAQKEGRLQDAFGAGTAATIAHIALMNYEGKDYTLPPVEERIFSNKVQEYLNNLKRGRVEDSFDWIKEL